MKKLLILLVLCSSCTLMIGEQYDGFVNLDEEVFLKLKIDWNNHCYIYRMIQNDVLIKEYREKFTTDKYVRTELSLYFGGDETAPHNMNIIYKYQ
jgi:hypothetical protein